ncbi:hypothetical protein [Solibacillus sp. FSL H8-0538]|uniref:hypothetical protein n=1 Tax=Solibacillus sp. FSL H8-0538 TaxID=2921400 RepID=UPI0030F8DF28
MDGIDCIMLKDNHLAFSGSITEAVKTTCSNIGHTVKIEMKNQLCEVLVACEMIITIYLPHTERDGSLEQDAANIQFLL